MNYQGHRAPFEKESMEQDRGGLAIAYDLPTVVIWTMPRVEHWVDVRLGNS
jgi:hypothetical protein